MSSGNIPEDPNRSPSDAEKAMSANARSRDRQGKAEDRALREHRTGTAGGAEQRVRGEPGGPAGRTGRDEAARASRSPVTPEARSISDARQDAEANERADDEGMGEPR